MDYLCAKFSNFSFSCFGFIMWTESQKRMITSWLLPSAWVITHLLIASDEYFQIKPGLFITLEIAAGLLYKLHILHTWMLKMFVTNFHAVDTQQCYKLQPGIKPGDYCKSDTTTAVLPSQTLQQINARRWTTVKTWYKKKCNTETTNNNHAMYIKTQ